jgi:hypothetical protein
MIRSPAFTSWSLPLIVALPLPEVKVRIWSTVCFYRLSLDRAFKRQEEERR